MDDYDSDNDISWLTQTPRLEYDEPNFDIGCSYVEEEMMENSQEVNVISLEEVPMPENQQMLYNNVVMENISSDENFDTL